MSNCWGALPTHAHNEYIVLFWFPSIILNSNSKVDCSLFRILCKNFLPSNGITWNIYAPQTHNIGAEQRQISCGDNWFLIMLILETISCCLPVYVWHIELDMKRSKSIWAYQKAGKKIGGCNLAFSPSLLHRGNGWLQPSSETASHKLGGSTHWYSSDQSSSMVWGMQLSSY